MERQIKFRVFDTSVNQYVTPHGGDFSLGVLSGQVRGMYGEKFPEMIVEQFTGLYDKNGEEIYEGDICENSEHDKMTFIVKWCNEASAFVAFLGVENSNNSHCPLSWLSYQKNIKKIGNLAENPGLLNK